MRKTVLLLVVAALAGSASAQLPGLRRRGPAPPVQPMLLGIDALRADFMARSGADTVYFGSDSSVLGAPARATLSAQAQWLLQHPEVLVRIEGHADPSDTRDHALAVGARRAVEVRDYLVLLGVPAVQLSATSWGKERPGAGRAVTVLVR
ncbi:OmpA family protein [Sphingomonas sp. URHD0057]|uniref:OmpA family protein n=1 Tax=Sphingomonas sp. URHD0057 TaxID=1380389 RepID=UPI000564BF68|nr:OmpA family protein [Sphingomonas sp. URHD0057]